MALKKAGPKKYSRGVIDPSEGAPVKTYRNVGVTTLELERDIVVEPDDEWTGALKPEFETQMLSGGHLEIVGGE